MLGAIWWLHSFRILAGMPSGPLALEMSRLYRHAATSSVVKVISDIWVSGSKESKLLSVSVVDFYGTNKDEKYELKSSAFSAGVLAVISL